MRAIIWTLLLCAGASLAAERGEVTGQYMEDRSSRVYGCPCEWASEFVTAGREAVLAWNIESGEFAGESLSGFRVVAVLAADFSLSAPSSLRRSAIFVDQAAPAARRSAGEAWLRSRYGDTLGRVLGVHVVPIDLAFTAEDVRLAIPGILKIEMRRARFANDTLPWADLLYDPLVPLQSFTLGTTLHSQYAGPDLRIRWSRDDTAITGYYGVFASKPPVEICARFA